VTVALVLRSHDDLPRLLSMLVYGLSMIELYAVSAVYHLGAWQGRRRQIVRALDHANIFILIAGTYTPICVNVLSGWLRPTVLVLIWALAAVGVTLSVLAVAMPRWATTGLYLVMGWVAIIPAPSLVRDLPASAVALLVGGGLLYSAGAVIYALKRPDPLPRFFGFHEVFHLFVIAGSITFLAAIWIWVMPFPRA
jgi:hemolysin III